MGAWKQKLITSWRWWIVFLVFSYRVPESQSSGKQSLLQYLRDQEFSSENRAIKYLLPAHTQTQTHTLALIHMFP
jgi:hypothetical protein